MKMSVMNQNGQRQWGFVMSDNELCEIVCSVYAFRALDNNLKLLTDHDWHWVKQSTVYAVDHNNSAPLEKLEQVWDPFLKAVLCECKRLDINLYESTHNDD